MAQDNQRKKSTVPRIESRTVFWEVLAILIGCLLLVVGLSVVMLQPMKPEVGTNLLVYVLAFLGLGLLVAGVIIRYMEQYQHTIFPKE